jgi:uncharacterized protein (DUF1330 family)
VFEIIFAAILVVLFIVVWFWQAPAQIRGKLTPAEINKYLADIERLLKAPDDMKGSLERIRCWAEADDGKPVYMLNLMRYFNELHTFPGAPEFQGTPEEANAFYEKNIARLLFKRGGYPILSGSAQSKSLVSVAPALDNWSKIIVVRYPSRRTFLSLMTDPAYAPFEPYKLMALEIALVPVSGELRVPELRWFVGVALVIIFLAVNWLRAIYF